MKSKHSLTNKSRVVLQSTLSMPVAVWLLFFATLIQAQEFSDDDWESMGTLPGGADGWLGRRPGLT